MQRSLGQSLAAWTLLLAGLVSTSAAGQAGGQDVFDIGTGGTATITGAPGGTVIVNPSPLALEVTVNFGEVSPINPNPLVRVSVPVIIRSEAEYRLVASVVSSGMGTSADAIQLSDIGIGIVNLRALSRGEVCATPHTLYPPFNTDPSLSVQRSPRASYPASLAQLGASTVVMSGPILSSRNVKLNPRNIPGNQRENGWQFDLIFALAPQFFAPGNSSATVLLTISQGPTLPCP